MKGRPIVRGESLTDEPYQVVNINIDEPNKCHQCEYCKKLVTYYELCASLAIPCKGSIYICSLKCEFDYLNEFEYYSCRNDAWLRRVIPNFNNRRTPCVFGSNPSRLLVAYIYEASVPVEPNFNLPVHILQGRDHSLVLVDEKVTLVFRDGFVIEILIKTSFHWLHSTVRSFNVRYYYINNVSESNIKHRYNKASYIGWCQDILVAPDNITDLIDNKQLVEEEYKLTIDLYDIGENLIVQAVTISDDAMDSNQSQWHIYFNSDIEWINITPFENRKLTIDYLVDTFLEIVQECIEPDQNGVLVVQRDQWERRSNKFDFYAPQRDEYALCEAYEAYEAYDNEYMCVLCQIPVKDRPKY